MLECVSAALGPAADPKGSQALCGVLEKTGSHPVPGCWAFPQGGVEITPWKSLAGYLACFHLLVERGCELRDNTDHERYLFLRCLLESCHYSKLIVCF